VSAEVLTDEAELRVVIAQLLHALLTQYGARGGRVVIGELYGRRLVYTAALDDEADLLERVLRGGLEAAPVRIEVVARGELDDL
jgi:hypothetical protein